MASGGFPPQGYECNVVLMGMRTTHVHGRKTKGKVACVVQCDGITLLHTEFVSESRPLWDPLEAKRCADAFGIPFLFAHLFCSLLKAEDQYVTFQVVTEQSVLVGEGRRTCVDILRSEAREPEWIPLLFPEDGTEYGAIQVKLSLSSLAATSLAEDAHAARLRSEGLTHGSLRITYDDIPEALDFSALVQRLMLGEPATSFSAPATPPVAASPTLTAASAASPTPSSARTPDASRKKKTSVKKATSSKSSTPEVSDVDGGVSQEEKKARRHRRASSDATGTAAKGRKGRSKLEVAVDLDTSGSTEPLLTESTESVRRPSTARGASEVQIQI